MMIRNSLLLLLSICIVFLGFSCKKEIDPDRALQLSLSGGTATPASVKQLLADGASPNTQNSLGYSPLMAAVNPIRLNIADPEANTPHVPDSEVYEICKILISAGANVNHRADNNSTPVSEAAMACYPETMQLFIDSGADIHIPLHDNTTPLVQAVFNSCPECAIVLLNAGADVHAGSLGGHSVLQLALNNRTFQNTKALAMIKQAANAQTAEAATNDGP